jgi:hypothetical protein
MFEEEHRWFVLKSEDIETDNVNWIFIYGGDANYVMRNILITEDHTILIYGTRYDWQDNSVWQRDAIILEIDADGQLMSTSENNTTFPYATVYPNPSNNILSIKKDFSNGSMVIRNINGAELGKIKLNENSVDAFYFSFLKPGIYLLSFYEGKKFLFLQKWIKK